VSDEGAGQQRWVEARLVAHWAAQIVAAAGATLVRPAPDDSHASLEWIESARALAGVPLGDGGVRAALRPAALTLVILDAAKVERERLDLRGQTLQGGLSWLSGAIARATGAAAVPLARPVHELPAHAVGAGAPFPDADGAALAELADAFSRADRRLRAVAASRPSASAVRCWPHHFDIATLLALDPATTPGDAARTIGAGLSPGDGDYPGGYWYVTPWPSPAVSDPPPLAAGGIWHRASWFGAVLPLSHPDAGDEARASAFLESAIAAGRVLLRVESPR
jgi:hypothetical protein